MCTLYLLFILKTYICLPCSRIGERTAKHTLVELLYVSRAGIGPELCHSSIRYSPTSSVLLSWCSLGGGRRMDLFCVCRRSSLSLLLTTCPWLTVHRRDWEEVLLTPPLVPFCIVCVYVSSCIFLIFHCLCGCFFLLVVLQWSGVERNSCLRPVELWWQAVLALAGTGDAERGEGGPIWAGTAAPAAGGVPGRPPLLPQLPVGTDSCAEFHLSAQLPPPGEPDED